MSNNYEDHIWITSQKQCVWGLGATMLSISQMCKPYALTEIKTKKKQRNMKGIFIFVKTVNSQYR